MTNAWQVNDMQARWIAHAGWVDPQLLGHGLDWLRQQGHGELAALLLERGLINEAQALDTRKRAARALNQQALTAPHTMDYTEQQLQRASVEAAHDAAAQAALSAVLQQSNEVPAAPKPNTERLSEPAIKAVPADLYDSMQRSREAALPPGLAERYEIIGELSRGAMGVVLRARERDSGTMVALKFMLDPAPEPRLIARFELEVQAMIRLKHPNIINIRDFGREDGHLFFAMDLIDGRDFQSIIMRAAKEGSRLDWAETLKLLTPIAEALQYCHQAGIAHRDVKPGNIIIERKTKRPVLLDFGLIKEDDPANQGITKTGDLVGTPAFMAPEQFVPGGAYGEVSTPADVWAFAATTYFAITGLPPFNLPSAVEIFDVMTREGAPHLRELAPDAPEWLDQLLFEAMTLESGKRLTMAELLEALQEHEKGPAPLPNPSKLPILLAIFGSFTLSLVLVLAFAFLFFNKPPRFLEVHEPPAWTKEDSITITGRASGPELPVQLGSVTTRSDPVGFFSLKIPLGEGPNDLRLTIGDPSQPAEQRRLTITRDSTAPLLTVLNASTTDPQNNKSLIYRLDQEDAALQLQVTDLALVHCSINGREADEVREDNLYIFRNLTGSDSAAELQFKATDKLGLETTCTLRVERWEAQLQREAEAEAQKLAAEEARQKQLEQERAEAAKLEKERLLAEAAEPTLSDKVEPEAAEWTVSLDPAARQARLDKLINKLAPAPDDREAWLQLLELSRWQSCPPDLRKKATNLVAARLGADFELLDLKSFTCGPHSFEVARFRHKASQLVLHLIPGGWQRARFWYYHSDLEEILMLRHLAYGGLRPELFQWLSRWQYKTFARPLLEALKLEPEHSEDLEKDLKDYLAKIAKVLPKDANLDPRLDLSDILDDYDRDLSAERESEGKALRERIRAEDSKWLTKLLFEDQPQRLPKIREAFKRRYLEWSKQLVWRDYDCYIAPMLIAPTELSQADFSRLGGRIPESLEANSPLHPIYKIDYHKAYWWADRQGLRLPNSSEWIYASRAGSSSALFWDGPLDKTNTFVAPENDEAEILPVNAHAEATNAFGLSDSLGNVAEWCTIDRENWRELVKLCGQDAKQAYENIRSRRPLMGGSVWLHSQLCRADIFEISNEHDDWKLSGLRLAASIPGIDSSNPKDKDSDHEDHHRDRDRGRRD